ncbi:MAG: phospho-sugar mutase, partial [Rhodoluna sp.]
NRAVFAKDSAEILSGLGLTVFLVDGICPTPMISFATRYLNVAAGIMVTASHNPPRDNGYKLYLGGDFKGSQIIAPVDSAIAAEIQKVSETLTFDEMEKSSNYELLGAELREKYIESVLASSAIIPTNPISIAYTAMHGVGWQLTREIFSRAGFKDIHPVLEQIQPDGSFPTVSFPNPEEPGAMDLALAKAQEVDSDIAIAHDPDADRLAVIVRNNGEFVSLTGDQVGLILAEEIARNSRGGTLASSIVSSSVLEKVAKHYGLEYATTLTGFKWISKVPNLVFGYEEALGYCIDPEHVLDKDGISASLMLTKIAARELETGKTLIDLLAELGNRYGHYATGQISIRLENINQVKELVSKLRATPPAELSGKKANFMDLSVGSVELPPTDGLRFDLGDSRVIIRPSGTEPKLKCYLQVVGASADDAISALKHLTEDVNQLLSDLG